MIQTKLSNIIQPSQNVVPRRIRKSRLPFTQLDVFGRSAYKMAWKRQESSMWLPEKEKEEIIGVVVDINLDGLYGKQYTLKTDDGKSIQLPSHKVLEARLISVKVNDKIKVVYLGEEPAKVKGNNPTRMYDVFIDA